MRRLAPVFAALMLACPAAVAATPEDLAYGAYQRGSFRIALSEALKRLSADPKDAAAMTLIGVIYQDGAAAKQDDAEAVRWFRLASDLGDPQASFALGALLIAGAPGVPADRTGALAQFKRAADKGVAQALYNLGLAATEGKEGPVDYAKAIDLFRRGADAGDPQSAYSFAELIRAGRGAAADPSLAAHYMKQAADAWLIEAQVEYGIMLFNGDGVAPDEAGAAVYLRRAAGRHNAIAQNRLAHLYLIGRGVPQDMVLATVWAELAKAAGLKDAGLDAALPKLSPADDKRAADLIRSYAAF